MIEATDNPVKILHYFHNCIINLMHMRDLVTWQHIDIYYVTTMQAHIFSRTKTYKILCSLENSVNYRQFSVIKMILSDHNIDLYSFLEMKQFKMNWVKYIELERMGYLFLITYNG